MKANRRRPIEALRALALPRAERAAMRSERAAEARVRRERDNLYSAERRAARVDAEAWRSRGSGGSWM
jgi:acetyl-CoA carboxylase carboxyltransferase component